MSDRFDQLTKQIGQTTSRRGALRALGAGLVGLAFGSLVTKKAIAADPATSLRCRSECQTKCSTRDPATGRLTTNFVCLRDCVAACNAGSCGTKLLKPCGVDDVTIEAIKRARLALAGGADDVPLSPQGCVRYTRQRDSNNIVISEKITYAGLASLVWTHTATRSESFLDADFDGCPEQRTLITRGATRNDDKVVVSDFSSTTAVLVRRTTYTRSGDVMRIVVEEANNLGNLAQVANVVQSVFVQAPPRRDCLPEGSSDPNCGVSCTGQQCSSSNLSSQFQAALDKGLSCLFGRGMPEIAKIIRTAAINDFSLVCDPNLPNTAAAMLNFWDGFVDVTNNKTVFVNPNIFCCLSTNGQSSVLFHEFLHINLPAHWNSNTDDHIDRVLACQSLCFNCTKVPDQCSCALCLGTLPSSSKCSDLQCCPGIRSCCPSGKDSCSTGCKDLKNDSQNCGACRRECTACETCVSGKCVQKDCGPCSACELSLGGACLPIPKCCAPGQTPCIGLGGSAVCCGSTSKCCSGSGCFTQNVICCKQGHACHVGELCLTNPDGFHLCCPPERPQACKDGCRPRGQQGLPPGFCS